MEAVKFKYELSKFVINSSGNIIGYMLKDINSKKEVFFDKNKSNIFNIAENNLIANATVGFSSGRRYLKGKRGKLRGNIPEVRIDSLKVGIGYSDILKRCTFEPAIGKNYLVCLEPVPLYKGGLLSEIVTVTGIHKAKEFVDVSIKYNPNIFSLYNSEFLDIENVSFSKIREIQKVISNKYKENDKYNVALKRSFLHNKNAYYGKAAGDKNIICIAFLYKPNERSDWNIPFSERKPVYHFRIYRKHTYFYQFIFEYVARSSIFNSALELFEKNNGDVVSFYEGIKWYVYQ